MFKDNSLTKSLKKIRESLKNNLEKKYGITDKRIINKVLLIHGIAKKNFDVIDNIENLIEKENINDISIDSNSNKSNEMKSIEGLFQEAFNPFKKIVGYRYLYREMKKLYGKEEANRLSGEMYDYSLALSDSTNVLKCYCFAFDFTRLVLEGRNFGQLKSKKSKRVSSYISALCETIHQLSSQIAGAVTPSTLFLDISHLMMFSQKVTLNDLRSNEKIRKDLENEFQQFVHSVNFLSRNSIESPFSNISIFDNIKLKEILGEKNFAWYFDRSLFCDDNSELKNLNEFEYNEYLINYVQEIQRIFINFFNIGDITENGIPYRFPLATINLAKNDNNEIIDEKYLDEISNLDVYRYNIFGSQGSKISSCCRLVNNEELFEIGAQSNSFGAGSSFSIGSHRVLTTNLNRIALECKSIENFYEILNNRLIDSAKILKAHKELLKYLTDKNLQFFIKNNWIKLNKLFSTFGIIGYYEAFNNLNTKFKCNIDNELEKTLKTINESAKKLSKEFNIIINIELIPGETMAVKLADCDRVIFGKEKVKEKLYSNQFIPLWEDATLWKRLEEDGKYNKLITGGGIVHAQIQEKVTPLQAKKIIKYAVSSGCEHFALNSVYCKCENGHTSFGKKEKCNICNGKIIENFTRVVGFFTKVEDWNSIKQKYDFKKRKNVKIID